MKNTSQNFSDQYRKSPSAKDYYDSIRHLHTCLDTVTTRDRLEGVPFEQLIDRAIWDLNEYSEDFFTQLGSSDRVEEHASELQKRIQAAICLMNRLYNKLWSSDLNFQIKLGWHSVAGIWDNDNILSTINLQYDYWFILRGRTKRGSAVWSWNWGMRNKSSGEPYFEWPIWDKNNLIGNVVVSDISKALIQGGAWKDMMTAFLWAYQMLKDMASKVDDLRNRIGWHKRIAEQSQQVASKVTLLKI